MMSSSPGNRPIEPISWLKIVFVSRLHSKSLEDLMDFLAFLVPKLWQNNRKLIREIPTNPLQNWGLVAISSAPDTQGSRSRVLKTRTTAWNPHKLWVTKSAHSLAMRS